MIMLIRTRTNCSVFTSVRRLSTVSYVIDPENPVATKWKWYWQDDGYCVWHQYDKDRLVSVILLFATEIETARQVIINLISNQLNFPFVYELMS